MTRRIVSLIMILSVFVFILSSCTDGNSGWSKTKDGMTVLEIGLYAPLTGVYDNYGVDVKNGASLAVDEINKAGGVKGFKLYLDVKDSKSSTENAEDMVSELLDNGMKISLGGVMHDESLVVSGILSDIGIPMVSPSASNNSFSSESRTLSFSLSNRSQGEVAADLIKNSLNYENIAILYNADNNYSKEISDVFESAAIDLGLHISTKQTFDNYNNTDFSDIIKAISESGAEMVFLPVTAAEGALILKQAHGSALKFFATDSIDGILSESSERETIEELYFTSPFFANGEDDSDSQKFSNSYKALYGQIPTQHSANAYDTVYAIAKAIENSGMDGESVLSISVDDFYEKIFNSLKSVEITGASGFTKWTSDDDTVKNIMLLRVKNGKAEKYIPNKD